MSVNLLTDEADDVREPGLYRRGSIWWGRVVIPKDLQHLFGSTPLRRTLKTESKAEARLRLLRFRSAAFQHFEDVRAGRAKPDRDGLTGYEERAPLTMGEVERALGEVVLRTIEEESRGASLWDRDRRQNAVMAADAGLDALEWATRDDKWSLAGPLLADALRTHGVALSDFPTGWRDRLINAACDHYQVLQHLLLEVAAGPAVDYPEREAYRKRIRRLAEPEPQAAAKVVTLESLVEQWAGKPGRKKDTARKVRRAADLFRAYCTEKCAEGSLLVQRVNLVTRKHAQGFADWLGRRGISAKTARDHLEWVRSLFRLALGDQVIEVNPFEGVKVDGKLTSPFREGFSLAEIARLFGGLLFQQYRLPSASKAGLDAAYWVPLLALYTGARLTELCQLRVDDIVMEDGLHAPASVPVLKIRPAPTGDEAPEQWVKTAPSIRKVPIHRELIRLGFVEYVDAIRELGGEQLFPAIAVPENYRAGSYFSTWYSGYRASLGFEKGAGKDAHNLRHTVRSRLAAASVPDEVIDLIIGHSPGGSTGRRVYTHATEALAEWVNKLTYPTLQLPRVYVRPAWTPSGGRAGASGASASPEPRPAGRRSRASGQRSREASRLGATTGLPPQRRAAEGASDVGRA